MISLYVAIGVFIAYFIESMFGFGGTILALAILTSFIDIKTAILLVTYAAIIASSCILISGYKHFSLKHLFKIYLYALPGVFIGTVVFLWMSPANLLKIFAGFLIFYSLYSLWKPDFKLSPLLSRCVLFLAGIIQGIYGTGAPFMLMAYRHEFKDKSELRSMVAAFLLFGNVLRVAQMYFMGELKADVFLTYYWIVLPVALAVGAGFFMHLKLNDRVFKIGVACLMLLAGISFLFK